MARVWTLVISVLDWALWSDISYSVSCVVLAVSCVLLTVSMSCSVKCIIRCVQCPECIVPCSVTERPEDIVVRGSRKAGAASGAVSHNSAGFWELLTYSLHTQNSDKFCVKYLFSVKS